MASRVGAGRMSRFSRWQDVNRSTEQEQAIVQTSRPRILFSLMDLNDTIFEEDSLHGGRLAFKYVVHFRAQRIVTRSHTG